MAVFFAVCLLGTQLLTASSVKIASDEFMAVTEVDECTVEGQHKIRKALSLAQHKPKHLTASEDVSEGLPGAAAKWLPPNPNWPIDPLEDVAGRFTPQKIGLLKAFNTNFNDAQTTKEWRDWTFCTFKRMECMSLDSEGAIQESMKDTRKYYALYDAMSPEEQADRQAEIKSARLWVIEPMLSQTYKMFVQPQKDFVEANQPIKINMAPWKPVPSMPISVEGDFGAHGDYATAGDGYLPVLLQTAEKSRQTCNNRPTEQKKMLCLLDFASVMVKLSEKLAKAGALPEHSAEDMERFAASFAETEARASEKATKSFEQCRSAKLSEV